MFSERILVLHTSIDYSLVSHELVMLHLGLEATGKAQVCKQKNYLIRRYLYSVKISFAFV